MPPEHSKKRNRITLSCNYCKKRKVKCDRGQPCSSCVKYNVPGLCEYNGFVNSENQHIGELPPFTIQNTNGLKRGKFVVNEESFESLGPQNGEVTVQTELEMLKDKIRQIEASITVSSLSQQNSKISPPPDPYLFNNSISNIPLSRTSTSLRDQTNPIQLPPLTWPTSTSTTPRSVSTESNIRSEQVYDYSNANLTYVGINPFGSSEETINFYEGYTPLIMKSSRRMNFGPFAWISLMSKDVVLRLLWKYAKEKKLIDHSGQKVLDWNSEKINQGKCGIQKDQTC